MIKSTLFFGIAMIGSALLAAPQVSNVTMTQDAGRTVTVTYTLSGEPGIVTADVTTNRGDDVWVSIGGQHLTYFAGDVNRRVETGNHTMTWKPHKAWPDNTVSENVKVVLSAWATNAPPDYMVMSLVVSKDVTFYTSKEAIPLGVTNDLYKTDCLVLRKIPAANVRWRMGSPAVPEETGRVANRETPHIVTLAEDYYLGVYPVTQRQYERIMNARPAYFNLESDYRTRPVERVSYETIRGKATDGYNWPANGHNVLSTSFMGKLRSFTGVDGLDLPLDAQWEFACRAGCGAAHYDGTEDAAGLTRLGRYKTNGGWVGGTTEPASTCTAANGTAKVGSYEPNAWGLYDMLGNVMEFCLDWWQESPIGYNVETGPTTGSIRVFRGGNWQSELKECRCAMRSATNPANSNIGYGFRVYCSSVIP